MNDKRYFLDTNVLIYAYTDQHASKAIIANSLIVGGKATISAQVTNELCHTLRRRFPVQFARIELVLAELASHLPIAPLAFATTLSAVQLSRRYALSYYDSLIVAAALDAGCPLLMSEDMQHGMLIDGRLRIENPFLIA
ncbi:MAG TPA: PIN domain-containing protein [Rhodocyclaceae bacterium]|nr:PIN domain-containing protein [Rhodocyclaceae bacterium]